MCFDPSSVAARICATRSTGMSTVAVTDPTPGRMKSISTCLSHTAYPGPSWRAIRITTKGSIIENIEPPKAVPK